MLGEQKQKQKQRQAQDSGPQRGREAFGVAESACPRKLKGETFT